MREEPRWRRYGRLWGADASHDIDDELRFHMEMKERDLRAAGVPRERVREAAERAFGDRRRVEAELRAIGRRRMQRARRASLVDELRSDVVQAWRSLVRHPGVPALAVVTLALGIGAGTAVFSLFQTVVLKPLAVSAPAELHALYEAEPDARGGLGVSYPMLRLLRSGSTRVSGMAAVTDPMSVGVRVGDRVEQVRAGLATGDYFHVLGVQPQLGRVLHPADEAAPGSTPYAVLSAALWQRLFGGDAAVIGRTLLINEQAFTVVGVAAAGFRGTQLSSPMDVWVPVTMVGTIARSGLYASPNVLDTWFFGFLQPVARIPAGTPVGGVLAELAPLHAAALESAREQQQGPGLGDDSPVTIVALPLTEAAAGRSRADLMRFLAVLAAVVTISLLIACVNVANLLLLRSTERVRDLAVRSALGAGAWRIVRQLLVESLMIGLLAAVAGAGVAWLAMRLVVTFALPGGIALSSLSLALDLHVLGFTVLVSIACSVGFGLAPAAGGARTDVMRVLREATQGGGRRRWRAGDVLVSVQVALSLVLLVSGFLFLRSLQRALQVDLGYHTRGVATVSVGLRQHGYTPASAAPFIRSVLEDVRSRPGVAQVAAAARVPIEADAVRLRVVVEGAQMSSSPTMPLLPISPEYFEVMGIPLLAGRGIEWTDTDGAPRVAVVTEAAAQRLWPGETPIGRQLVAMFGEPYTVVGIVRDGHYTRLTEKEPHVFLPLQQSMNLAGMDRLRFVARGDRSAHVLAALREAVRRTDARLPTFDERDVTQQLNAVLMPQRFGTLLLATFGVLALLISAVGIYAVASFDVARRRRELGIRAALGARRGDLVGTVLRRSGVSVVIGAAAGLAAALVVTRSLQAFLFGIGSAEPVSYIAAVFGIAVAAITASWIPARRASRADPLRVIRE